MFVLCVLSLVGLLFVIYFRNRAWTDFTHTLVVKSVRFGITFILKLFCSDKGVGRYCFFAFWMPIWCLGLMHYLLGGLWRFTCSCCVHYSGCEAQYSLVRGAKCIFRTFLNFRNPVFQVLEEWLSSCVSLWYTVIIIWQFLNFCVILCFMDSVPFTHSFWQI